MGIVIFRTIHCTKMKKKTNKKKHDFLDSFFFYFSKKNGDQKLNLRQEMYLFFITCVQTSSCVNVIVHILVHAQCRRVMTGWQNIASVSSLTLFFIFSAIHVWWNDLWVELVFCKLRLLVCSKNSAIVVAADVPNPDPSNPTYVNACFSSCFCVMFICAQPTLRTDREYVRQPSCEHIV